MHVARFESDITMPISYVIDKEQGVALATASGELTENDLLEHKRKLFSDPEFRSGFVELSDVRFIEKLNVSPEGIRKFVAQDSADAPGNKEYKLAIVVSQDLAFGMGRMYEMSTSKNFSNVRIFRDMQEARTWLGLAEENSSDA